MAEDRVLSNEEQVKNLYAEMAQREMARRYYRDYLAYVHGAMWKATRMSDYIANEVQRFLEEDTGHAYDILVIESPPQHGKECADSTPVPTPTGWKRHGDLQTGDYVFDPDGKPIKVLNIIPQEQPASLLVTFTDGEKIKVHPNHEWVVYDRSVKRWRTLETKQMMKRGTHIGPKGRGGRYKFQVKENSIIQYDRSEQTVHPYFLGLWLGDGTTEAPVITHHPDDMGPIDKAMSLGYDVSSVGVHKGTGILATRFYGKGLQDLKTLNFGHAGGDSKYIPEQYKIASAEQRLELLAGMIDSDGYVYPKNGRVTISNANKVLIDDFAEVVRSLGWRATVSAALPQLSTSGVQGRQTVYQLTFNPTVEIPTALPRKKTEVLNPLIRRRGIVSIEPCEPESGKCITVEGGVYLVGKQFVPTHNSMTITETLPSWYLGKNPNNRIIIASYDTDFAEKFCRRNKEKVKNFGANLFNIGIGNVDRAGEFELNNGKGRLISRGIMSGITGNPANLVIIDDPVKNMQEADSPTYRSRLWEEWQASIKSRLQANGKVVVIMTPWHEDDFAARILNSEPNSSLLRLPVAAEENDPLGREVGEPLCPELGKDANWLSDFRESYIHDPQGGQRSWTALYQCSPRAETGNVVHRDWWRFYDPNDEESRNRQYGKMIVSVDAAFKDTDSADYVSIQVWGKNRNDYFLLYCLNRHLDFPGTVQALRAVKQLYPQAHAVYIEDKANGSAIISTLQHEMYCIPVNPRGGKKARVNAISFAIESGHVYLPLPEGTEWVSGFIDQFTAFPNGAHDDMVDACSQALNQLLYDTGYIPSNEPVPERELKIQRAERDFNDPAKLFNPYGGGWFG